MAIKMFSELEKGVYKLPILIVKLIAKRYESILLNVSLGFLEFH